VAVLIAEGRPVIVNYCRGTAPVVGIFSAKGQLVCICFTAEGLLLTDYYCRGSAAD
jgi:hypothetical protein